MSELVKCVFIWHSPMDSRTCQKCAALNGRVYHDQDVDVSVLIDPEFGPIWDLNTNRSLMHGASGTCRCWLEVRVETVHFEKLSFLNDLDELMERMM